MYTEFDAQRLLSLARFRFVDMINAKNAIQQAMWCVISFDERMSLSQDILEDSLISKVLNEAQKYATTHGLSSDVDKVCVAMAAGTILKELDDGNTEFVRYPYLASIMNQI